jgi:predicted PP-loop superfamily ATPase
MTTIRTTKRVETLLSDKKINSEANDYHAYGRTLPGHTPPLFGQQYKFGKAEAAKLTKSISTSFDTAAQKRVLKEIYARSSTNAMSKGTVALTREAATELNKLATTLGLTIKFTSGQPRPIHPVG